ncbi:lysine exporter LysO family protein [Aeropyrum pernix]|uniref:lysine exporter LysO family protein n=1 Tax=Aeropyrum pernix TaxID=56636 RepID=UPI0011E575A1|nr:lysine exporter LysO family protein [Aeropyrum pernix]
MGSILWMQAMELAVPAVAGVVAGAYMRGAYSRAVEHLLYPVVWALVFTIGAGVGSSIDLERAAGILYGSILIAILPGAASVAVAALLAGNSSQESVGIGSQVAGGSSLYSSPAVILAFFLAGLASGWLTGSSFPDVVSTLLLYILLFQAGYLVGGAAGLRGMLRGGRLGLLLALSCLVGGVIGGAAAAFVLGWSLEAGVAMGVSSGWYSLAGPLLYTIDPYYGAVALVGNMLREAFHIVVYPLLARRIPIQAVAFGGATTMDTGLPVILASSGERAALPAFVQGALLTLLLSLLLPLYVSTVLGHS